MEVEWNSLTNSTYINEPIGNQTFHMEFQAEQYSANTVWINVYMTLYNKRSQINGNEAAVRSTGLFPLQTIKTAMQAFNMLEADAIMHHCNTDNIIIYCTLKYSFLIYFSVYMKPNIRWCYNFVSTIHHD